MGESMKVVVCNGGYKTGSTLTFNIMLKVVETTNEPMQSYGHNDVVKILNKPIDKWYVVKSHTFCPDEKMDHLRIVHTYRNPFSVAASCFGMVESKLEKDRNHVINVLKTQKKMKEYHSKRSDTFISPYEQTYENPHKTIRQIAEFLKIEINENDVENIASDLTVDKVFKECQKNEEADPYTQLRPDNISKYKGDPEAWKQVLSDEFVKRIKNEAING